MKQTSDFRRMQQDPSFPKWNPPKIGLLGTLAGIVIWIFLFIAFVFFAYVHLFSVNTVYLLQLIHPGSYVMPYWLSILLVLFFFPGTLIILLLAGVVKVIRSGS